MSTKLTDKELGVVQVVLERYNREWLPSLLAMRKNVDQGQVLGERDRKLLGDAMREATGAKQFVARHPEYARLVESATHLYEYIQEKSAANEARDDEQGP